MADILTPERFFLDASAERFEWGENDCVHIADRWATVHFGRSFVEHSAQRYHSEAGAIVMALAWPLPVWVARAMRRAGFWRVNEAAPGDIGVIVHGRLMVCAVRGSGMWLYRQNRGVGGTREDVRVLGLWRG
ncbi:hypothetical protein [Mesorhizobium sp. Z1-4]|uniref:DUF6950 family protein n=1 Tax=Mesorhizobium sp. Z1-4 TaxID=2448478 RepID=UPI000FD78814|nr:hypothetical protein [Mesorhizobium sp. Z1-4]